MLDSFFSTDCYLGYFYIPLDLCRKWIFLIYTVRDVSFWSNEVMMSPSFLICFSKIEALRIQVNWPFPTIWYLSIAWSSLDSIILLMYVRSWTMCWYLFAVWGNSWTHWKPLSQVLAGHLECNGHLNKFSFLMFIVEWTEVLERLVVELMFWKYDAPLEIAIQMKVMQCAKCISGGSP
jgi:hypothetical protein